MPRGSISGRESRGPGSVEPVHRLITFEPADLESTTAAPFRAMVEDSLRETAYWLKVIHGPGGPCGLIAEAIVSRLGALIGAPVCETAFVDVQTAADREFLPNRTVGTALAYGSREVPSAKASRSKSRLPSWSATSLEGCIDIWRDNLQLRSAADPNEIGTAAAAVTGVTHTDLVQVLDPIASAWKDTGIVFADGLALEETLRRVGAWLEHRRDTLVNRLLPAR